MVRSRKRTYNPFWTFLLFVLAASFITFIPSYAFFSHKTTFWPELAAFRSPNAFFWRSTIDIFRIAGDFFLLLIPAIILRKSKWLKPYRIILWLGYVLSFLVLTYVAFNDGTFALEPQPYVDWLTVSQLLGYYLEQLDFMIFLACLGSALAIILVLWFFYWGMGKILAQLRAARFGWVQWGVLGIFYLAMGLSKYQHNESQGFHELGIRYGSHFVPILWATAQDNKKSVNALDAKKLEETYSYQDLHLQTKPNLYFLFIESYGEICFTNPELKQSFYPLTDSLNTILQADSITAYTAMSEAPVVGNRSWLSYTSSLYGFDVENMAMYNYLNETMAAKSPSMFKYLRQEGYKNYKIVTLESDTRSIPWDKYTALYSIDKWFLREDLNYSGPGFGWQGCPPDDYSLGFVHDTLQIMHADGSPYCVFFLNQNSHFPYAPDMGEPPTDYKDWNTRNADDFNDPRRSSVASTGNTPLVDYQKTIAYQLKYLVNFIKKNAQENDLFLLVGDHQPPRMGITLKDGTANVPVHIISRNKELAAHFDEYGFVPGLNSKTEASTTNQAFFSMYLRALSEQFGDSTATPPPYLPQGVLFK